MCFTLGSSFPFFVSANLDVISPKTYNHERMEVIIDSVKKQGEWKKLEITLTYEREKGLFSRILKISLDRIYAVKVIV